MSSTNEEIPPPPPKPKQNPLEFRNTDLVSRLLAATPPYLYNMPLVPHSYFFSEMLRSLVQGKTEAASRIPTTAPHRRSRKRTWLQSRNEFKPMSSTDMPPPNWTPKLPEKVEKYGEKPLDLYNEKPVENYGEKPLELTMNKLPLNNNTKLCHTETLASEASNDPLSINRSQIPISYPGMPNITPGEAAPSADLILPPTPPIWYPPLYPAPYGIDPLHFFIDLRVSGHIYDRKNSKDPNINMDLTQHQNHLIDMNNSNASSTVTSSDCFKINKESIGNHSRHTSAFTVPVPSEKNNPLNLSNTKYPTRITRDEKPAKFDIKSMGFDTSNNQSTNYILKNLQHIYKNLSGEKQKEEGIDLTSPKEELHQKDDEEIIVKDETNEEKDSEKEKKCKDLRALIGLELVVDYVKHEKPGKGNSSEDGSVSDLDSNVGSPALEVVTISDVESKIHV